MFVSGLHYKTITLFFPGGDGKMKELSSSPIVSVDVGRGYNDSSMSVLLTSESGRDFKAFPDFYH